MNPFTKYKFLRLEPRLQHKTCAMLLREIYESLLENKTPIQLLERYHSWIDWMRLGSLKSPSLSSAADRYHWHLKKADIVLKEHNLLPPIRRGDREAKLPFGTCAIYLDNLRSAYNVGSILRTTEALRLGSVCYAKTTPDPTNPKVAKTSMGSSDIVPVSEMEIEQLPRPIIVLDTATEAVSVNDFIFPGSFTLVLGNEEAGVSDTILQIADYFVDIPLFGKKNSINVACAFGICAQEIRRQWNLKNSS
jgi:tRNA(Leu) C34 or U34 (ribose-2'-O)-methylase TrmL